MSGGRILDCAVSYLADDSTVTETDLRQVEADRVVLGSPVRRVRSFAGQRHYCGSFWSATIGAHLVYESRLELDRLWLADFDPDVVWIATQPLWLCGDDHGTTRRHVPDVMLKLRSGKFVVVDVKPVEFQARPGVIEVLDWTSRACAAKGWRYEVWGGADPVILANIRHLGYARRAYLLPERGMRLASAIDPSGFSWGDVADQLTTAGCDAAGALIAALLWRGVWRTDLTRPLGRSSVLTMREDPICPAA
ncbi:TnsA-like heteromeric transposase endonuclease subunit [Nocardia terpenica]|uniref:TnsA-like heteromeric transposase endonuclease subunit n=1 Tax=Nocardia terpenica TaxID=455432 RepID=UPI00142E53F3|nr:TnsA-like heteromeric transposase endonuclease subunit [Nocardia terpenica]